MSKRIELIDQIKSPTTETLKVGTKMTYVNPIVVDDLENEDIPSWAAVQSITGLPIGGTITDYLRGDGSWADLDTGVDALGYLKQADTDALCYPLSANPAGYAVLPSQTGNSGKFLSTNGSVTSWQTVSSGSSYTAGTGLNLASNVFSLNTTYTDGRYIKNQTYPTLQAADFYVNTGRFSGPGVGTGFYLSERVNIFTYQSISGIDYTTFRSANANTETRLGIFPNGNPTTGTGDTLIAGIKIFGTDFSADETNNSDWGLYGTSNSWRSNSKHNGTGTLYPFIWSFQDINYSMGLYPDGQIELGSYSSGYTHVTGNNLNMFGDIGGQATSRGIFINSKVLNTNTNAVGVQTNFALEASGTFTNIFHFEANNASVGAGTTVSVNAGFYSTATLGGVSTNINAGFRGALPYSSANWNLYMDGTAKNYLAGQLHVGMNNGTSLLQIFQGTAGIGTVSVTAGSPTIAGTNTTFFTTFSIGQNIIVNTETRTVLSIASNTSMATSTNFTNTFSGVYTLSSRNVLRANGNGNVNIPILTANQLVGTNSNSDLISVPLIPSTALFTRQNITTGTSGTVSGGNYLVTIDPASTLATYTLTMPASPNDIDLVQVSFGGTLTAGAIVTALIILPNSGQTILDNTPPGNGNADDTLLYRYRASNTTWYRFKP